MAITDDDLMHEAWGAIAMAMGVVVGLGGCRPRPTNAAPAQIATPPLESATAPANADPMAAASPPAPAVSAPGLPTVPALSRRPIKVGRAYTVWGASYSLRHPALTDSIRGKRIEVRGIIGKTNLMDAPKCAVHPPGIADPPDCQAPMPEFWLCDDRNDALEDCIQVMGWASNYAQLYRAIRSCAQDPPTPALDDYWGKEITCPIPAAGARVTVKGTYGTTFTGASSGTAADPIMGIVTSQAIETHDLPPAPARLP